MKDIEFMILSSLVHDDDYATKVFPFIKKDHFESENAKIVFDLLQQYKEKYGGVPTKEAIAVDLHSKKGIPQSLFEDVEHDTVCLYADDVPEIVSKQNHEWLLSKTEKYLVDRACYNAVMQSMSIIDGEDKTKTIDTIPEIFKEALTISFDTDIGHDFAEDYLKRYEFYHKKESRIKFSLSMLNKITGDGMPRQSLMIPVAGTGVGKSMFLTNEAAHFMMEGLNVLYVSLELAEERVAERIDAKLMNMTMDELRMCPKNTYENKINTIKRSTLGKLIIKQYPPGTFHSNHLRYLIKEIQDKKGVRPDIILVDYLGIMASYRKKSADDSYGYLKAVAEELRGVAMEYDCLAIAPMQTNRSGQNSTDSDLTNMSESHGVSMTGDMIFVMLSTPEMEQLGHIRFKQLKNRFGCINSPSSFLVGTERSKMRLFDMDTSGNAPSAMQPNSNLQKSPLAKKIKPPTKGLKI